LSITHTGAPNRGPAAGNAAKPRHYFKEKKGDPGTGLEGGRGTWRERGNAIRKQSVECEVRGKDRTLQGRSDGSKTQVRLTLFQTFRSSKLTRSKILNRKKKEGPAYANNQSAKNCGAGSHCSKGPGVRRRGRKRKMMRERRTSERRKAAGAPVRSSR